MLGGHLLKILLAQSGQRTFQRDGLLFGFASSSPEELRAGVKALALALGKERPELRA
jgi:hypothetical protein